ncbi:MAG: polysaccharide biosynthesis protein [Faecalimonas sp.]|nr:polysaccharide biosynthesis protein [Faecalimonas sp.]
MGNKRKKNSSFLMQGVILAVAGIITRLIGIAYRIPVNNILGDEGQGFYGCAFSIYNIALLLTSYSLPLAVSKLVSARVAKKEYKNASRIFRSALIFAVIVGALVGTVVFVFADFIAGEIMSLRLSAYALRVLAPCLFVVAVMGVVRGFFQGMGTMVPTACSQIVEQIVNAIISILGASYLLEMGKKAAESKTDPSLPFAYGAAGGTMGTLLGAFAGLLFLGLVLAIFYPSFRRRSAKDITKNTEGYGDIYRILLLTIAPVILSTAIYNISETLDQGIFSNIMVAQGSSEKETAELLGMFTGKYNTLINIPLAVANAVGAALIPSLTATIETGTKKEIYAKINTVLRFVMMIAVPCAVGFVVMAEPILDLLYSGNIAIPARMLQLGAITVIFYCLSTVSNAILQGVNKMSTPVKHGAISLLVHLLGVYVMLIVFHWGIYAIVVGNIIFSLCMCLLNARALRRAIGYRQDLTVTFLTPIKASLIMGLVTFALYVLLQLLIPKEVATLLSLFCALLVYAICMLKYGAISADEILALPMGGKIYTFLVKTHLIKEGYV